MTQTFERYNPLRPETEDAFMQEIPVPSLVELITANGALLAHETLRRLVQIRNMHDTGTFVISGRNDNTEPNPTDEELFHAAAEVAALTMNAETIHAHNLSSVIPDDTGYYEPATVEVASLLVDAAGETSSRQIKLFAEVALKEIDSAVANPLTQKLDEAFGETSSEQAAMHAAQEAVATDLLDMKSLASSEKQNRLAQYTETELDELDEIDDAVPYDPFADD